MDALRDKISAILNEDEVSENVVRNAALAAGAAALASCGEVDTRPQRYYLDDNGHIVTIAYDPQLRDGRVRVDHQNDAESEDGNLRRASLEPLWLYNGEIVTKLYDYTSGHSMIRFLDGRTSTVPTIDVDEYREPYGEKTVTTETYESLVRRLID